MFKLVNKLLMITLLGLAIPTLSISQADIAKDTPDQSTGLAHQQEVQHLLEFVKNSACSMTRNGANHSAPEAAQHIQSKYHYFKEDIQTTEGFIQLTASRSTLTGQNYQVHCNDQPPLASRDWLMEELYSYRFNKTAPAI